MWDPANRGGEKEEDAGGALKNECAVLFQCSRSLNYPLRCSPSPLSVIRLKS